MSSWIQTKSPSRSNCEITHTSPEKPHAPQRFQRALESTGKKTGESLSLYEARL